MLVNRDDRWWGAVQSQSRDLAANDNRNAQQQMQDARALQAWAASRPEWADLALEATRQARETLRQHAPRAAQ